MIKRFEGEDSPILIGGESLLGHIAVIDSNNYIALQDDSGISNCNECVLANICCKSNYNNDIIPNDVRTICELESDLHHHYINLNALDYDT